MPVTDPTQIAADDPKLVTVFEHHDADGATLDVAIVEPHRWQLLTVDEARDLAGKLIAAVDLAESCSAEFDVPLRTR
jgi:hypothetical protein